MSDNAETIEALGELVNPQENNEEESKKEVAEPEAPKETPAQEEEADDDTKPDTDWKAASRKWEDRAKANKAAADELPKVTAKLEAATKELAEQKKATQDAQAELMRFRVAAKYAITEEHMNLFLTGSDEETLEKQAAALSERTPKTPRPDRAQGNRNGSGATSNADAFAAALGL
ncbi:hypothetical protein [Streptomyces lasalocidi]|uniref:DUF4355 domain-containing protein n=1 Tax=Streptomyces lasalocidi TaxID=324833 RepID=A0A4U5WMV2_STRLS|nr:hypothetical protein [Streptomyces lasalocidi]TKT03439.1 hypothetical protein E4U91_27330 [Streptomyces lasalocidi]